MTLFSAIIAATSVSVVLVKATQLILSLSILIVIHEFGHFLFARLFKTRVEKFYLFFNPWFSLYKKQIGETEFGIGWLPLGGYAKISGMIDESMDKEQLAKPAETWEYRAKKPYQRLFIVSGGVLFNLILAFVIYTMVMWVYGEEYLPNANVKYGIECSEAARSMGFENGDKILKVNNLEVDNFAKVVPTILLENATSVTVERNGLVKEIVFDEENISRIIKMQKKQLIAPRVPFVVQKVVESGGAYKAGVKKNDVLIGVGDSALVFYDQFSAYFQGHKSTSIPVKLLRNKDTLTINVTTDSNGLIGVYATHYSSILELNTKKYGFWASFPAGFHKGVETLNDYFKQLKLLFQPKTKAYESLGGFIMIGSIFPDIWHWESFWNLTAFLSIILAVMNILPIPALDGGHVIMIIYEMITKRKPSDKFLEYAQIIGMVFLFSLLIYANMNDVIRLFK